MKKYLFIILFLLAGNIAKAELTTEQVLQDIRDKVSKIESMSVTIRNQYYLGVQGNDTSTDKKILKKPNLSRTETVSKNQGNFIFVQDGSFIMSYSSDTNNFTKSDGVGQEVNYFPISGHGGGFYDGTISYIRNDYLNDEEVYVIENKLNSVVSYRTEELRTAVGDIMPFRLVYYIRIKDGLALREVLYGHTGKMIREHDYSDYRININVSEETFQLVVPEGAKVVENPQGSF